MAVDSSQLADKKTFRDLIAYQKSKKLVKLIYQLSSKFPKQEFALQNQIQRAVVSIPANIAEGQQRYYPKELIRFLYISRASLAEVEVYVDLALDLGYISSEDFSAVIDLINEVGKLINGLINSLKESVN